MYSVEIEKRFWLKVNKTDKCWNWKCGKDKDGYGQFWDCKKNFYAHRFSFQLFHNRLIQDKMFICHTCDNPSCVRPDHLFEGTHTDNMTDMVNKGRTHTLRGSLQLNSKLTEKQVLEIRKEYTNTKTTQKKLAIEYGVCQQLIGDIINRKKWNHV